MILFSIFGVICPQLVRFSGSDITTLILYRFKAFIESGDLNLIWSRNLRCIHWSFKPARIAIVDELRRWPHLKLLSQKTIIILIYVIQVFYFIFVQVLFIA